MPPHDTTSGIPVTTDDMSRHFSWSEMTRTGRAEFQDNDPPLELHGAGFALVHGILEPIRRRFGRTMVHSGYRSLELNRALGSSDQSQHRKWQAADFHVRNVDLIDVYNWLRRNAEIPFGQLILENPDGGDPNWIHVSIGYPFRDKDECGEVLTFDGSGYTMVERIGL